MLRMVLPTTKNPFENVLRAAGLVLIVPVACLAAAMQHEGPLPLPPPAATSTAPPTSSPKSPERAPSQMPVGPAKTEANAISKEPPAIPVDQIIQKFGEREAEFRKERDNYTYTQTVVVQTIDSDGRPDGEYRMTSDILFTPDGKRYEKVTSAPPSTLERMTLTQQDFDDVEHVQPFVLTTEELPKYDVKYVGREQLDEISTYVFDVAPKKIEKNQRYFQGRIWVDDKDLEIVKTDGKAVPDIIKKNSENIFPRFETFRENIEGHYWFPTYTRSDDVLHFSTGAIHTRMTIRYANYKRFGSTIRIGAPVQVKPDKP